MRRGTTPTLKAQIDGVDLSELFNIYITVKQGDVAITKTGDEIIIEGAIIYAPLTQEDTLQLSHGYAYVQMRATTSSGLAIASDIGMVLIEDILKDGVIM